uniref:BTB domain-containing protein n=1 Tax=Gouania willdenowi TaxID=441366 RepID=A0A8C5DJQ6_GOUWI
MIRIKNSQYFHFLQQADALRRSGLLCDAVISVKTQTFRAHRLVLACASRTLAQHLTQGDRVTQVHCTLDCFSPHTFQQVLDFTYTQALHVSANDLPLLLQAAQLLQMPLLEDECQRQLDSLHCSGKEQSKGKEFIEVKEEKENTNMEEKQEEQEERLANKDLQERSSPAENSDNVVVEYIEPVVNSNNINCLPFTRKKSHSLAESEPVCSRDSVIARPTSSISSFSSPWTLSTDMWESVSSLRRTAESYSNMVTATPHQPISPFSAAQPFSPSSPHMFPLLSSRLPTPVQSSSVSYSGLRPHYKQNLLIGSTRIGSIINKGLLKRKKPSQREVTKNVQRNEPR